MSETQSVTPSQQARFEEEKRADEEYMKGIKASYNSIIDNDEVKYKPKMVGLNPNMRPSANQSLKKIFPMQGIWPTKSLMKSTNNTYGVSE